MLVILALLILILFQIGKTVIVKNAQNDCIDLVGCEFKIITKHRESDWVDIVDGVFIVYGTQPNGFSIAEIKIRGKKKGHIYDLDNCVFKTDSSSQT